jgi:hypothetical protein
LELIVPFARHTGLSAVMLLFGVAVASADGIEPGLWKTTSRTVVDGMPGPARESTRCLTAEQSQDIATTFSPVMQTINSECAPIERSLVGGKLSWRLVCKGQLDMELVGDYTFDSPRHYTATVRNRAAMAGTPPTNVVNTLEGERISACE